MQRFRPGLAYRGNMELIRPIILGQVIVDFALNLEVNDPEGVDLKRALPKCQSLSIDTN